MAHTETLEFEDPNRARSVFGHRDEFLRLVEGELTVDLSARGARVTMTGDPEDVAVARAVLQELYALTESGYPLRDRDIVQATEMLRSDAGVSPRDVFLDTILAGAGNRPITPKTAAQKRYVDLIRTHDVVFGLGPAGTGKTYLAMAVAVAALSERRVKRIILTRPAVEAGERLGFLPGDLMAKVSPYLRPLYDALHDMMDGERARELVERGVIEVVPLAFMRGRTLNESFIILDEAQNSTREQMKMFLTRLGYDSRTVITGDATQVDLEKKHRSGLSHAVRLLDGVRGIGFCRFTNVDVVRHPLVRRIIAAYEREDRENERRLQDRERGAGAS